MTTRLRRLLRRIGSSSVEAGARKLGVSASSVYRYGRQGLPEKRKVQVSKIEARKSPAAKKKKPASPPPAKKRPVPPPPAKKRPAPPLTKKLTTPPVKKRPAPPPPVKKPAPVPKKTAREKELERRVAQQAAEIERFRERERKRRAKKPPRKTKRELALERLKYAIDMGIGPTAVGPKGEALYIELADELGESEADIFSELSGSPRGMGVAA